MLILFCVLGCLASMGGGGGLSGVYSCMANEGYSYSKYRVKSTLEGLASIGAVSKVGKSYTLTLLGSNLVAADIAAAEGWEVIKAAGVMKQPPYQKEY